MPSAEENALILWCLIEQKLDESGQLGGIDWQKVSTRMGIDNIGSTRSRWNRLKTEFQKMAGSNADGPINMEGLKATKGAAKAAKTPAAPKTKSANPKARSAVEKKKKIPKSPKARKTNAEEEDGDVDGKESRGSGREEDVKEEQAEDENA